jgi:hypothetical protein
MDLNDTTHPDLSFDGCGINGRDQYRTRIATFTDKRGPVAQKYGTLFAAAPEMLEALKELLNDTYLADPINKERMAKARYAVAKAEGKS